MNSNKGKMPDKGAKKDRPRSSEKLKKRRDGTPDKPTTPGPDDDGSMEGRANVINDEEIQNLAIKQNELDRVRQEALAALRTERPASVTSTKPFIVKRANPKAAPPKPIKSMTVAKGAPPRAPLKPIDTEGNCGPRFDNNGNVISHSILGTLEEYKEGAKTTGSVEVDYYIREQDRVQTPSVKVMERFGKSHTKHPKVESNEESNALLNWQKQMRERKLQQGYISKLLQKPVDQLVMNQGDAYRIKQEVRHVIDRSIPAVDYGKGYRVGSEFWNQRPLIGDELTGVHMTLGHTEQGYPPPIEHIGLSTSMLQERGLNGITKTPWHRSKFLKDRSKELGPVIQDLDPHEPDMSPLEVVGTNNPHQRYVRATTPQASRPESSPQDDKMAESTDPLADHPDVYSGPVFGPCIKFAGQVLQWSGDSFSNAGCQAADARVGFESLAGVRTSVELEVSNLGTTAIYYKWKMLPKSNPFDLVNANVQRFYFDTSGGVILPGDTLLFPFVFKSEKAGVFTEQWQFETHPAVAGGATLVVSLRGIAVKEDMFRKQRELLEAKLQKNIMKKTVQELLDEMIDNIREPERARSPLDSYITEEEQFNRQNPQLHYKHDAVTRLRDLYNMFANPPMMDGDEDGVIHREGSTVDWDMDITSFKEAILSLKDDDDRKVAFLETINEAVVELSFPIFSPRIRKMYKLCHQHISSLVDQLSGHSVYMRSLLGLPEREVEEQIEETRSEQGSVISLSSHEPLHGTKTPSAGKSRVSPDQSRAPVKVVVDNKGVKSTPSKGAAKPGKEEKKSGKNESKKDAKQKEASQKKADRASPVKKTPPAKAALSTSNIPGGDGKITPAPDGIASPSGLLPDPSLERKYLERFNAQVYTDINNMILSVVDAFEDIDSQSHFTR